MPVPLRLRPARRPFRRASITLAALAALAGASAVLAQTMPLPPRDEKNASFWQRIDHPPADGLQPPRAWYTPLAALKGAAGAFLPAAAAGRGSIGAQALEEASQYAEATGAQALIVVHKGVVQLERYYGGASAASQFSSHSLTKLLAALAVGKAIEEGHIGSVDQPASTWLPEWRDEKRQRITLRQLLEMTAGFRTPVDTAPSARYMQMHYGSDVEAIVASAMPAIEPGSAFVFDNDNLHAIGLVLERATGKPYQDYVSQRLWQPLGAADAEMMMDRPGGRVYAYCCSWTLPRDWARIGQMLLQGGQWQGRRVLPESWVQAMRAPSKVNPSVGMQAFLGAAWLDPQVNRFLQTQRATLAPSLAPDLSYHIGYGGQLLAVVPSQDLVIVRAGKAHPAWRDQVLPNLMVAALQPAGSAKSGWLYDWRQITRPAAGTLPQHDPRHPAYWPEERVAGAARPQPLPRRAGSCLTPDRLAGAQALVERAGSSAFLVWRDGAIEHEWYGPGHGPETRLDPASMHKTVLGIAFGLAQADGFVRDLDAPVSTWLKEWAGDARGRISLRQMLNMASGLAPLKYDLTPGAPYSRALLGADSTEVPLQLALADTPGQVFNYQSPISQLLGLVLERATGERYAQYLSRRLWQPLGAADAWVALDRPGGLARTASALMARPEDWLRLGLLFADGGRFDGREVVPARWIEAMRTPSPANPNYGLHLWLASPHAALRRYNAATPVGVPASQPFLAADTVFFDGAGAQRVYVSAKEKLVIVREGTGTFQWDDSALPNAVLSALRSCR